MAFVVVQHLPPERESLMAEILARHTHLPVLQVTGGLTLQAGHVYVTRPGFTVTLERGVFRLGEPVEKRGRSEERRVGEEGRSRWAPDYLKKKKERESAEVCRDRSRMKDIGAPEEATCFQPARPAGVSGRAARCPEPVQVL